MLLINILALAMTLVSIVICRYNDAENFLTESSPLRLSVL